jgi:hypothetical protein
MSATKLPWRLVPKPDALARMARAIGPDAYNADGEPVLAALLGEEFIVTASNTIRGVQANLSGAVIGTATKRYAHYAGVTETEAFGEMFDLVPSGHLEMAEVA